MKLLSSSGQHKARTHWNTHESGTAFDRKKTIYLTGQAQAFIAQQVMCVLAGVGSENDICGLLVMGYPNFVQVRDEHTLLFPLAVTTSSRLVYKLSSYTCEGPHPQVAICFIMPASRERLCVYGTAELVNNPTRGSSPLQHEDIWICVHVTQSFFHCPKYIRTMIDGLTISPSSFRWRLEDLMKHQHLTDSLQTFLEQQVLCFLCTVNSAGECAVNHRGGKIGFLLTSSPNWLAPRGAIWLPDYEGNGAFEAIGNIIETGQAALVIPHYSSQIALCISGRAQIVETQSLSASWQRRCNGAKRLIRIEIKRIEGQKGDWNVPLEYERERSQRLRKEQVQIHTCPL